jgi:hypothetical protein
LYLLIIKAEYKTAFSFTLFALNLNYLRFAGSSLTALSLSLAL